MIKMPEHETDELSTELVQEAAYVTDTTCPVCYAEFLDAEDLLIHVQQVHTNVMSVKPCQFCSATYTDLSNYAKHVRDTHIQDLRACKYCAKVFLNGGKLKLHEAGHVSGNLFSCSQCKLLFPNTNLLELHELKNHDNRNDGVFLKCMANLSELLCLKAKSLLQMIGKKVFTCYICEFSSPVLREYNSHLDKLKCEPLVCETCTAVFKNKKCVWKHMKRSNCINIVDFTDESIFCPDCKRAVHPKALEAHSKSCKALKCIDCDFVCKSIDKLSEHQAERHPLGMSFIRCKYCTREFIGEIPLKKHVRRVHKPYFHLYKYECRDCKAIFQHPQKLFAHFYTNHKDIMPFNCKICNKSFRVRKSFSLHIKLDHKSVGFVEFDDKYHVFFTATKSDKPFVPKCVLSPEEMSDFGSENNETEGDLSDSDITNAEDNKLLKIKPPKRKKIGRKSKATHKEPVLIYSSDEEPLLEVKKRALQKKKISGKSQRRSKKGTPQFICEICDKNCYTYQNHQNHMNTHNKNHDIECVKCSEKFRSKTALNKHMTEEHASSKLTETLKNLLKKKQQDTPSAEPNAKPKPFEIKLTKVKCTPSPVSATIKPVETSISVKNFIENFTPDIHDQTAKPILNTSVTIKPYTSPYHREPLIKLKKFKDLPTYQPVPLKMPQRFTQHEQFVKTKISIRLIPDQIHPELDHSYLETYQEHDDDYDRNDIPEVAQEVSLEGTEEPPSLQLDQSSTKIIIPKMPKGYSNIHIATLQSEAPFFKIIKVDSDNMTEIKKQNKQAPLVNSSDVISLPDGKRLVTANPLAHLIGDALPAVGSYRPAARDFQGMLASALLKLDEGPPPKKRKKREP